MPPSFAVVILHLTMFDTAVDIAVIAVVRRGYPCTEHLPNYPLLFDASIAASTM